MSLLITIDNGTDPLTGLPIVTGLVLVTENGDYLTSQVTGEPPGGLNQTPGVVPNVNGSDDPGLPYGFQEVPQTGPTS